MKNNNIITYINKYLNTHFKVSKGPNMFTIVYNSETQCIYSFEGKEDIIVCYIYSELPKLFEKRGVARNTMRSDTSNSVLSKP